MLIAAVIVYPIDIPTRFEYWDTAQSLYLIPPVERERKRERERELVSKIYMTENF